MRNVPSCPEGLRIVFCSWLIYWEVRNSMKPTKAFTSQNESSPCCTQRGSFQPSAVLGGTLPMRHGQQTLCAHVAGLKVRKIWKAMGNGGLKSKSPSMVVTCRNISTSWQEKKHLSWVRCWGRNKHHMSNPLGLLESTINSMKDILGAPSLPGACTNTHSRPDQHPGEGSDRD